MNERGDVNAGAFWGERHGTAVPQRYQTLSRVIDDGIYQLDADGRFVAVNDVMLERLGYAREDLVGEHASILLNDADVEAIERAIRTLRRTDDDVATLEVPLQTAEGGDLHCELRISLHEEDGEFRGTVGLVRDITERRERERTLREERTLLNRVFEASPVGITALAPDGEIITLNDRAAEIVGSTSSAQVGETYDVSEWEVYDADGEAIPPREQAFGRVVETGEPVTDLEVQVRRRDGDLVWLSFNGVPIFDEGGELSMVVLTYEDITVRKDHEQDLRREKAQTEKLLQTAPIAISVQDSDGETILANKRAQDALGLSEEEFIDEPEDADEWTVSNADGEELPPEETPTARVLATGEPVFDEELVIDPPNGERMWFRINTAPVFGDEGELKRVISAGEDITELKERERQLERRRDELETELGELLGRISDAFYALDDEFRFTHLNERAEEIMQYSAAELHGRSVWDVFPEATEGVFWERFHTAMDTQVPVTFEYYAAELDAWLEFNAYPSETGLSIYFQEVTERVESERALEESEWRYRTLVENFPNGSVGLFNEELEYTAVGGQLLETLDMEPTERVGNSIHELHSVDLVERIEPYFRAALAGESNSFEVEFRGRYLHAHTLPVRNAADEIFAGMLVVQDVTERRDVQQELRESEAKFRMLAENLVEIVWMATGDAAEFIYVNPAFEAVWGMERTTLYDEPLSFLDAVAEEDRGRVRQAFTELPEVEFDEEFRIVRPDGEVRWVHARGARVDDEDSGMVRVVGIGEDITERVDRETDLERALDLLEKTERIADVGGWEIDVETMDVFWTDHIYDLLGVSSDEEPPLDEALAMYHEEDQPLVESAVEEALDSGDPFDVEVRVRTDSGEIRWLRLQGVPEVVDEEVVSFRGAAQDISERKQREQTLEELIDRLEESNERLEQFAYAASHDLQEPLRMVSSYLQLIEQRYADTLDEDGREFIEFAIDGADRMRAMIDGLLEYSRVERNGGPLEPLDLESVVEDALRNLTMQIEECEADVTVDPLPRIQGDSAQLQQVFQNLLSNAIKYSESPPRVHVSAEREGDEWIVSVRDEGIGIEPEHQDRIFEVFQRLHGGADQRGTGIGLALCERIVERHGGTIRVDSEQGMGSTFSFTLPAVREADR